ncbi:hypothetical protein R1sor_011469 [Riccia sorocarpa]|uniref:Uncharacterized protein n=1 Tax=Riccia sorocarpa TaxID=122646 RepID=A0ABD3I0Z7_9MARC
MSERGECSKSNGAVVEEEPPGSVVNTRDFLTAVKKGNISFVKTLLEVGAISSFTTIADIDAVPELEAGSTALHQAVAKGLHLAAAAGNNQMLDVLLGLHPNVNILGEGRRTPLNAYASSQGASLHIIKKFLEEGADPNIPDQYGLTCLHMAVSAGNVQMVRHLLNPEIYSNSKMLVDINAVANGRLTALHIGVSTGREDVLLELLNHSPDVNVQNMLGSTALHLSLGKLAIFRKLLEVGADPRIAGADKRNVLHDAVLMNKLDVVKCLLDSDLARRNPEKSLDINAVDKYGVTALHFAVKGAKGPNHDMVEIILDHQPDVNIRNREGDTAFDIYCGDLINTTDMREAQTLKAFLRHRANPSFRKYRLRFHLIVSRSYPDYMLRCLYPDILGCLLDVSNYGNLQYRPDPNELDGKGLTLLHLTVGSFLREWPEMTLTMNELLKHGADPNIRTQLGWIANLGPREIDVYFAKRDSTARLVKRDEGLSALHIAVVNGLTDAVAILLANGADVDALDNLGMTALMLSVARLIASSRDYHGQDVVKLLLQHRARVSITGGAQGQNCLHMAAAGGLSSILKDILEASNRPGEVSIINSIDEHGATALHQAAETGNDDAVEVLLDHNADVNVQDNREMSPFMLYLRNRAVTGRLLQKFLQLGASVSMNGPQGLQNCLHIAAARG